MLVCLDESHYQEEFIHNIYLQCFNIILNTIAPFSSPQKHQCTHEMFSHKPDNPILLSILNFRATRVISKLLKDLP